jgi:two-component system phosphate regulon sensor histidine kinase PhoR
MRREWANELRIFGALVVAGTVLGAVLGSALSGFAVGTLLYAVRHIRQAWLLNEWLVGGRRGYPPEGDGIWRLVFAQMNTLTRADQERHHRLSTLLSRFRRSARAIPDGLVLLDSGGGIQWTNLAATAVLGIDGRRDAGQRIENLVRHPSFVAFVRREVSDEPLLLPAPSNPDMQIEARLVSFAEGYRLLIIRDNTERQKVATMRRDFVANVSHELRTPLTVLSGYLENMDRAPDMMPDRWRRPVSAMHAQVGRMRLLIEDLLTLAKVEVPSRERDAVVMDVPAVLSQVRADVLQVSESAPERIELNCDLELRVRGVHEELRTVITNLISNAVQYTPAERVVEVSWLQVGGDAVLTVHDHGDGIGAEHLPRLTERFYRVDPGRSREKGGTGLGLSIVRHVLEAHGAALTIDSEYGEGSTFTCRFPAAIVLRAEPTLAVANQ